MEICTRLQADNIKPADAIVYARLGNEEALGSFSESANKSPKNIKRAALYSRTASKHSDDDFAIEDQKQNLRNFALQMGFEDFTEYSDNGFGGLDLDRPAFRQMEADIKAGLVDSVVVRSVDRVARDFILTEEWLIGLEKQGVHILTMDGLFYPCTPLRSLIYTALAKPATA